MMKRRLQYDEGNCSKKRVTYSAFTKWKRDLDKECHTLNCESLIVKGKKMVERLKCKICLKYKSRLVTCKYFWIVGAESLRTSNVRDHAHSEQHSNATSLYKKQRAEDEGLGPSSYAPIA